MRLGGTSDTPAGDGASPGPDEGDDGTDETPAGDDAFPQDDPTCPDAATVATASNGGESVTGSQPAFTTLELSLMARPRTETLDALLAVGGSELNDFAYAAILVRFADDGLMDARDGSVYSRDIELPYEPGVWYTVVISADIASQSHDVEVARCGEPLQPLIRGAAFRSIPT